MYSQGSHIKFLYEARNREDVIINLNVNITVLKEHIQSNMLDATQKNRGHLKFD